MIDYATPGFELRCAIENRDITHVEQVILREKDFLNAVCLGEDQTPLAYACELGFVDVARFLVDRGADVNVRMSSDGYTALFWAVMGNRLEAVKFLVESGSEIDIQSYQGETLFDMTHEDDNVDLSEIYEYLKECQGDVPFSFFI